MPISVYNGREKGWSRERLAKDKRVPTCEAVRSGLESLHLRAHDGRAAVMIADCQPLRYDVPMNIIPDEERSSFSGRPRGPANILAQVV